MNIINITGGYQEKFKLENISFDLEKGKIYALLGLNGSGKTTILKMICGILKTESGRIMFNNKDILKLREKDRAKIISYVPQKSNIVYDSTVIDIVLMGVTPYLEMFNTPNKKHIKEAYNCLEKLGILKLAQRNYFTLSEGQKQLVIIARALMQNSECIIMDEPDSSLDIVNKHKLIKKIRDNIKNNNKTCIISMHAPEYALNYCDEILLINNGKISKLDINYDNILLIEEELSVIYGQLKILCYNNKYIFYYGLDEAGEL